MTRPLFFAENKRPFRELLYETQRVAAEMLALEVQLIELLKKIDQRLWYKFYGFNSLTRFCTFSLKLSRTQTQRIVTRVRRTAPPAQEPSDSEMTHRTDVEIRVERGIERGIECEISASEPSVSELAANGPPRPLSERRS